MKRPGQNERIWIGFALALSLLSTASSVTAWSSARSAFQPRAIVVRRGQVTMYMPPTSPMSQTPNLTAQRMLKNLGTPRVQDMTPKSSFKLSNSVLASCDTLPSFPTSHGLLSPETVLRMEELTSQGRRNKAVSSFLKTYRQQGPLSCLPMLSDPDVLPHLTAAMRDIAA